MLGRCVGDRVLDLKDLVALEVKNGSASKEENQKAAKAAARMGINGIGGSDAHGLTVLGRAYTLFSAPIKTPLAGMTTIMERIIRPVRHKRFVPEVGKRE
ncbi:MAG: hypothetical protein JRJ73_05605 [Deltaproteobacteria bacterium]|nr:hypothetical protein [Deltaproteobacteria bacterium]